MHDIGINSDWKHELYQKHYPEGFELVWLDNPKSNDNFLLAAERNEELGKEGQIPEEEKPGVTITYSE